jgi:methylated-DNA-[protein]-cysteine S-methyltransferase
MPTIITNNYLTPFGELLLGSFEERLCLCDWRYRKMRNNIDQRVQTVLQAGYQPGLSGVLEGTKLQLEEYFSGIRKEFTIPLQLAGSDFQQSVWNALLEIPYGTTMTYSALSKKLGNMKAIRAVASANGANALSILVPCHRVIGSSGELTGYAGGLSVKKKLLQLEQTGYQYPLAF